MELAGGAVLDGAASAELAALLEGIADISVNSTPKFTPAARQALLGMIVGRGYGPPMLELCHLIRVAALAPRRRFEDFFWGVGLARAGAYAGWVGRRLAAQAPGSARVRSETGGVAIDYVDGRFAISYSRMPALVALMEFLVASLGYPAVLESVEALLTDYPRISAVGAAANALSRAVYAWLTPHLPTAHEKRRLDILVGWLTARHGAQGFTSDDVDDESILAFWLTAEEPEFRTFAAALRGFLLLVEAMEDAAASVSAARAARLGADKAAGEIDPATSDAHAAVDAALDPLAALAEPPADAVKFLNARERTDLTTLLDAGPIGERLTLSLLRRAVFGAMQARISEALRRGGAPAAARVVGADAPEEGYEAWRARADELATHLERAMLGSLHVLAAGGRLEAAHLLMALERDLDVAKLRAAGVLANPSRLGAVLTDPAIAGPRTAALMLRARRAFAGLSRAGFEPDAPQRSSTLDGHAAAAAHLPRLEARLGRFRAALNRRDAAAWSARQAADHRVFTARFAALYALNIGETAR
jgi:hypothetical protein